MIEMIYAFFSTVGFAVIFNVPRKELALAGISGALAWVTYATCNDVITPMFSAVFAGLVAGLVGEVLARIRKRPSTLYFIPGIIPLVPGYGLYYMMLQFINGNPELASQSGTEALLISVGIALGVILSSSFGRIWSNHEMKSKKLKG